MPKTSRALMAVQAVLVALQLLASATTIGDMFPGRAFPLFVILVAAAQAAVAFYTHGASNMTGGALVVLAALAGLQAVASSVHVLDNFLPGNWLSLFVMLVAALQAGAAYYTHAVTTMPGDPPPGEPGRLAAS